MALTENDTTLLLEIKIENSNGLQQTSQSSIKFW